MTTTSPPINEQSTPDTLCRTRNAGMDWNANGKPVEAPDPDWIRGNCPDCGARIVSNLYGTYGQGYVLIWECWASFGDHIPDDERLKCDYRRLL